jgi:hypothetical protein
MHCHRNSARGTAEAEQPRAVNHDADDEHRGRNGELDEHGHDYGWCGARAVEA